MASGGSCCNCRRRGRSANTFRQVSHGSDLVFKQAPNTPPRHHAFLIQAISTLAEVTLHAPLQQHGIEQFAMQPDLGQRAVGLGPQGVHIEQALLITNRNMIAFDLALGTGAVLAPEATLKVLGHDEPSPDAARPGSTPS